MIKAGRLRPRSNAKKRHHSPGDARFYSVLCTLRRLLIPPVTNESFHLFPQWFRPVLSPRLAVSVWLLFGCRGSSSKRTCAGCTLAGCSAVLAGFSFSLPVIAHTQEMKQARKEIHGRRQRRSLLLQPPDECGRGVTLLLLMLSRLQDEA